MVEVQQHFDNKKRLPATLNHEQNLNPLISFQMSGDSYKHNKNKIKQEKLKYKKV